MNSKLSWWRRDLLVCKISFARRQWELWWEFDEKLNSIQGNSIGWANHPRNVHREMWECHGLTHHYHKMGRHDSLIEFIRGSSEDFPNVIHGFPLLYVEVADLIWLFICSVSSLSFNILYFTFASFRLVQLKLLSMRGKLYCQRWIPRPHFEISDNAWEKLDAVLHALAMR